MVYHHLTTLRLVYFARTAEAALANKPVLALLIHDIPLRNIAEPLNVTLSQRYLIRNYTQVHVIKQDYLYTNLGI